MAGKTSDPDAPVVIKKYANRRLYNTASSSYVTLDHLCQMVKEGHDFVVYDAKSGEDITRSVLTQIIVEEEGKGQNLLPIRFLRQLIGFYGDNLQALVPGYLEVSMESFARNQEQMRKYVTEAFDGMFPFRQLEELSRQNMTMFQRAMSMFTPFVAGQGGEGTTDQPAGNSPAAPAKPSELDELRAKVSAMERQLAELAKKR